MIKKINILLILVSIIGSLYFVFTKAFNIIFILKALSIILTINGLYIIQKLFKIKINESTNFIYVIFIFMAHFLGVIYDLYTKIYWFDKLVHFLSGIVSSFGAIYILVKFKKNKNLFFDILYIIAITLMIASLWEVFEYLASYYFNVDPQKVVLTGVSDTIGDIIVAFLGSILVSISYYYENKYSFHLLVRKIVEVFNF